MSAPRTDTNDLLRAAEAFGRMVIEPKAEEWQDTGGVPREYFSAAAAHGLCGLLVEHDKGGQGAGAKIFAAVLERLARHCLASTFALVVHANLAGAIARHGTPLQRQRYLGPMLEGELVGAFLLTEPGVGSDAQAIEMRAERRDGTWVLNGRKAWITNANHADILSVYAQTEPGSGARGIACFLVPATTPGVERGPASDILGGRALGVGRFGFRDCRVEDDAILHAPGAAFRAAMGGIDVARMAVAAMCCGSLARAIEVAVDYVRQRQAFGQPVADLQAVRFMLADCATDLEAARALTAKAATAAEAGSPTTLAASHAKKFASLAAHRRITDCMQVMGAAGLLREYPLARHLAGAKIAQYLDGATEVQNVVIARDLIDRRD